MNARVVRALLACLASVSAGVQDVPATCAEPMVKVVHLVFHSWGSASHETPPNYLVEWRSSFARILGPSWKIRSWNAPASRNLVFAHYPEFLATYDNYPLPIQRVDAVRYLILQHFGGLYADLDYELLSDPTPLLCGAGVALSLRTETADRYDVQNSFMYSSIPGHPFWDEVLSELKFRAQMPLPRKGAHGDYIMLTTGPAFISDVVRAVRGRDFNLVLLPAAQVFPFNFSAYEDAAAAHLAASVASVELTAGGLEQSELPVASMNRNIISLSLSSSSPPPPPPPSSSCVALARAASEAARQRGAFAIHHFVGAWTATGPRCKFD